MTDAGDPRKRLLYGYEAAKIANVAPATIRDWVRKGQLKPKAVGKRGHLYLEADVLLVEKANRARRTR